MDLLAESGSASVKNTDIGDGLFFPSVLVDQGGNLAVDPLFVKPGKDVHLTAGSPLIDAGTCTGAPTTDIDGDPRPTGAGCDIGADEFVP